MTLFSNKGKSSYTIEKQLEPGEQIWANLGDIIRGQIPDKNGKTIPRCDDGQQDAAVLVSSTHGIPQR